MFIRLCGSFCPKNCKLTWTCRLFVLQAPLNSFAFLHLLQIRSHVSNLTNVMRYHDIFEKLVSHENTIAIFLEYTRNVNNAAIMMLILLYILFIYEKFKHLFKIYFRKILFLLLYFFS